MRLLPSSLSCVLSFSLSFSLSHFLSHFCPHLRYYLLLLAFTFFHSHSFTHLSSFTHSVTHSPIVRSFTLSFSQVKAIHIAKNTNGESQVSSIWEYSLKKVGNRSFRFIKNLFCFEACPVIPDKHRPSSIYLFSSVCKYPPFFVFSWDAPT